MNFISIQNLCNYLEELGIVDKKSINPFLSLYTKEINNNINIIDFDDDNSKSDSNNLILENVLCLYLKKIFNIEKNYKIFSHKIISKFRQNYLIKQYNSLFLLFLIISKKIKYSIFKSFYNIKQFNQEEQSLKNHKINAEYNEKEYNKLMLNNYKIYNKEKSTINSDNDYSSNIFFNYYSKNDNRNTYNENKYTINENGNGISINDFEANYKESNSLINLNKKKIVNYRNTTSFNIYTKKAKSLNNSLNYMKKIIIQQNSAHIKNNISINKPNKSNYNNIQFENKKNQFLSRIKRDHSITFKKKENFNNLHISKIYSNKSKENKGINYIEYNKKKDNEDSTKNNNKFFGPEQKNYNKRPKISAFCYSNNNYDKNYDIYHLNKSKSSLDHKHLNININNFSKNKLKEINNDDNLAFNIIDEISSIENKNKLKNGNLIFDNNYIGMKNLKYNNFNINNNEYYKGIGNNLNIDALTSNELYENDE